MNKIASLFAVPIAACFALCGCGSNAANNPNAKIITLLSVHKIYAEEELAKHKTHSNDVFDLTVVGSTTSPYFTLVIHCDNHDSGKECVFYKLGVYKDVLNELLKEHENHGDDDLNICAVGNAPFNAYSVIISCKH